MNARIWPPKGIARRETQKSPRKRPHRHQSRSLPQRCSRRLSDRWCIDPLPGFHRRCRLPRR